MEVTNGFLILNKGRGCTSHDCVKKLRKLLKIKKIGHAGTLDPQVEGVLPLAIGKATRFIQYLPQDKTYLGTIQLGKKTSTDDIHGEIINEKEWPILDINELNNYVNPFRGKIKQVPPNISSVHIKGERAYKRSWNKEEFEIPAREVNINEFLINGWDQETGRVKFKINCSSGTYIRSIARDLGRKLQSEGCLYDLKRVNSSGFNEDISIDFATLSQEIKNINKIIIPIADALFNFPKLYLSKEEKIYWETGRKINMPLKKSHENKNSLSGSEYIVFDSNNNLLGMGIIKYENKYYLQPKLVLNAK